jgi:hypothetical protein
VNLTIEVDGKPVHARAGQSLAAALIAHGIWSTRRNPVSGEPRGPFCGMGVCFECEVNVDGVRGVRACMTEVAPRMVVSLIE